MILVFRQHAYQANSHAMPPSKQAIVASSYTLQICRPCIHACTIVYMCLKQIVLD